MCTVHFRTLLEGCSFQRGAVYQDGVSLEVAMKRGAIQSGAGGAGGEATDQTASESSVQSTVLQVTIACLSTAPCSTIVPLVLSSVRKYYGVRHVCPALHCLEVPYWATAT